MPASLLALDGRRSSRGPRRRADVAARRLLRGRRSRPRIATDEILVADPAPAGPGRAPASATPSSHKPASGYSLVGVAAVVVAAAAAIDQPRPRRRSPASARSPTGPGRWRRRSSAPTGRRTRSRRRPSTRPTASTVNGDIHADAAYRAAMAEVYTRRAIEAALARARRPGSGCRRVRLARIAGPARARRIAARRRASCTRDLDVDGQRWSKGRRLSPADLDCWQCRRRRVAGGPSPSSSWSRGDVHEDDAALRLAAAVAGAGLTVRGPAQSRVDLVAEIDGVLHVRSPALERLNRLDPLEVFTRVRRVGRRGRRPRRERQGRAARRRLGRRGCGPRGSPAARAGRSSSRRPVPARARRGGRQGVAAGARPGAVRGERPGQGREPGLDGRRRSPTSPTTTARGRGGAWRRRGAAGRDLVLTAGGGSTDPADPFFVAIERLGGRVVRHGVPGPSRLDAVARRGSAETAVLGLPTCGAYSKATAADLLLPRLLQRRAGRPPRPCRHLGHGGILTRDQRFRFPPYARELDAPEGLSQIYRWTDASMRERAMHET